MSTALSLTQEGKTPAGVVAQPQKPCVDLEKLLQPSASVSFPVNERLCPFVLLRG